VFEFAAVARLLELVASYYAVVACLLEPVVYLRGPVMSECAAVALL
jgi:hypothetical protein